MKIILTVFCLMVCLNSFAQKYDTIRVGLSTAVHLIFESKVNKSHVGLGKQIDANGNAYEDVLVELDSVEYIRLSLTAGVENFETTNLFVETESGYFNFILLYTTWPKQHIFPIANESASVVKKVKISKEDLKQNELKRIEKLKLDSLTESSKIVLGKKFLEPTVGEKKQKMVVYLNGIYVDERHIFFRVTMKNEGNVKFDIGSEVFQIQSPDNSGVKDKSTVEAPESKQASYTLNEEIRVVAGKEELSKVYVFEKFTVAPKKKFVIDIWEKKPGQRIFQLKIPSSEILSAERL